METLKEATNAIRRRSLREREQEVQHHYCEELHRHKRISKSKTNNNPIIVTKMCPSVGDVSVELSREEPTIRHLELNNIDNTKIILEHMPSTKIELTSYTRYNNSSNVEHPMKSRKERQSEPEEERIFLSLKLESCESKRNQVNIPHNKTINNIDSSNQFEPESPQEVREEQLTNAAILEKDMESHANCVSSKNCLPSLEPCLLNNFDNTRTLKCINNVNRECFMNDCEQLCELPISPIIYDINNCNHNDSEEKTPLNNSNVHSVEENCSERNVLTDVANSRKEKKENTHVKRLSKKEVGITPLYRQGKSRSPCKTKFVKSIDVSLRDVESCSMGSAHPRIVRESSPVHLPSEPSVTTTPVDIHNICEPLTNARAESSKLEVVAPSTSKENGKSTNQDVMHSKRVIKDVENCEASSRKERSEIVKELSSPSSHSEERTNTFCLPSIAMKKGVIHHSNRKMHMARRLPTNVSDVNQNHNNSNMKYINSDNKNTSSYDFNSSNKTNNSNNSSVDSTSHSRMASLHRADSILHRGKLSKAYSEQHDKEHEQFEHINELHQQQKEEEEQKHTSQLELEAIPKNTGSAYRRIKNGNSTRQRQASNDDNISNFNMNKVHEVNNINNTNDKDNINVSVNKMSGSLKFIREHSPEIFGATAPYKPSYRSNEFMRIAANLSERKEYDEYHSNMNNVNNNTRCNIKSQDDLDNVNIDLDACNEANMTSKYHNRNVSDNNSNNRDESNNTNMLDSPIIGNINNRKERKSTLNSVSRSSNNDNASLHSYLSASEKPLGFELLSSPVTMSSTIFSLTNTPSGRRFNAMHHFPTLVSKEIGKLCEEEEEEEWEHHQQHNQQQMHLLRESQLCSHSPCRHECISPNGNINYWNQGNAKTNINNNVECSNGAVGPARSDGPHIYYNTNLSLCSAAPFLQRRSLSINNTSTNPNNIGTSFVFQSGNLYNNSVASQLQLPALMSITRRELLRDEDPLQYQQLFGKQRRRHHSRHKKTKHDGQTSRKRKNNIHLSSNNNLSGHIKVTSRTSKQKRGSNNNKRTITMNAENSPEHIDKEMCKSECNDTSRNKKSKNLRHTHTKCVHDLNSCTKCGSNNNSNSVMYDRTNEAKQKKKNSGESFEVNNSDNVLLVDNLQEEQHESTLEGKPEIKLEEKQDTNEKNLKDDLQQKQEVEENEEWEKFSCDEDEEDDEDSYSYDESYSEDYSESENTEAMKSFARRYFQRTLNPTKEKSKNSKGNNSSQSETSINVAKSSNRDHKYKENADVNQYHKDYKENQVEDNSDINTSTSHSQHLWAFGRKSKTNITNDDDNDNDDDSEGNGVHQNVMQSIWPTFASVQRSQTSAHGSNSSRMLNKFTPEAGNAEDGNDVVNNALSGAFVLNSNMRNNYNNTKIQGANHDGSNDSDIVELDSQDLNEQDRNNYKNYSYENDNLSSVSWSKENNVKAGRERKHTVNSHLRPISRFSTHTACPNSESELGQPLSRVFPPYQVISNYTEVSCATLNSEMYGQHHSHDTESEQDWGDEVCKDVIDSFDSPHLLEPRHETQKQLKSKQMENLEEEEEEEISEKEQLELEQEELWNTEHSSPHQLSLLSLQSQNLNHNKIKMPNQNTNSNRVKGNKNQSNNNIKNSSEGTNEFAQNESSCSSSEVFILHNHDNTKTNKHEMENDAPQTYNAIGNLDNFTLSTTTQHYTNNNNNDSDNKMDDDDDMSIDSSKVVSRHHTAMYHDKYNACQPVHDDASENSSVTISNNTVHMMDDIDIIDNSNGHGNIEKSVETNNSTNRESKTKQKKNLQDKERIKYSLNGNNNKELRKIEKERAMKKINTSRV